MATDQESKGRQFMSEADQKLDVTAGMCCASRAKIEEACELYVKAANSFKMGKNWSLAGNAFSEAAALELNNKRPHEAGSHYAEASKCYKKENTDEAIQCLLKAAEIYTDMGRRRMAAKNHESIAELYETEAHNIPKAIEHYVLASEMFRGEESSSAANKCLLSAAKFSALQDDFERAIEIYESVGKTSLDSSLLKYTANDLFLRAALCHICVNPQKASNIVDSYAEMSPAFSDSKEYLLIRNMAQKVIENDADGFNEAIRTYESFTSLGAWHKDMIRKIRKQVGGDPDLR